MVETDDPKGFLQKMQNLVKDAEISQEFSPMQPGVWPATVIAPDAQTMPGVSPVGMTRPRSDIKDTLALPAAAAPPRRGARRSPANSRGATPTREQQVPPPSDLPMTHVADKHLPNRLLPDPLQQQMRQAHQLEDEEEYDGRSRSRSRRGQQQQQQQQSELHRRLQDGLDRLADETDPLSGVGYSRNLGRAEFGVLKPKSRDGSASSRISRQASGGGGVGGGGGFSRDASGDRHQVGAQLPRGVAAPATNGTFAQAHFGGPGGNGGGSQVAVVVGVQQHGNGAVAFQPSAQVLEKKKEILQKIAVDKKNAQDAKGTTTASKINFDTIK